MQGFLRNLRARLQKVIAPVLASSYRDLARIYGCCTPIVLGVPAAAAGGLLFYAWIATPQYAATTTVLVELPKNEKSELTGPSSIFLPRGSNADLAVDSHVKIIQSSAILGDVIGRLGLTYDSEFAAPLSLFDRFKKHISPRASAADSSEIDPTKSRVFERLRNHISASRDERTLLINIQARSTNADKAAAIANSATDSYLKRPEFGGVHLITAAMPPTEPLPAVGWPMFGFVLAAGVLLGGALASMVDSRDRRIKTLGQLNETSGLPAIAVIPQVGIRERARRAKPSREDLKRYDPRQKTLLPPTLQPPLMRYAYDDPTSTFADGIRAIRLAIQRASKGTKSGIIMVTSASDSEGKSTLSTNLARSFAMTGASTVLVDCDLRNPEVTGSLCPRVDRGLADAAFESEPIDQFILEEEISGLSVLPAPPSHDFNVRTELAFSAQFSDVLSRLRDRFEIVILDAPPLIPLTDSRALADHADCIIVTTAWNQTQRDVLVEGLALLAPNLHRVLGCVLSRVDMDRLRYYDHSYGEAYREPYRPSL